MGSERFSDELKSRSIGLRVGIIRAAEAYAIGGENDLYEMARVAQKELVECGFIKEGQKP